MGGFKSARQEAQERRSKAHDEPEAEVAETSAYWWQDPGTLVRFHDEFERQLPGALEFAANMRAKNADQAIHARAELARLVEVLAEAGVPSAILREHEIHGLPYDSMTQCASLLQSKLAECKAWIDDGAKLEELSKLKYLAKAPEDQPVEFILSRMAGRSIAELDPHTAQDVARLRNDFVREFSSLESQAWETRPAAYFAMEKLGLPDGRANGQAWPPIQEFIPMLASIVAEQQALRERYLAQLEIFAAQLKSSAIGDSG